MRWPNDAWIAFAVNGYHRLGSNEVILAQVCMVVELIDTICINNYLISTEIRLFQEWGTGYLCANIGSMSTTIPSQSSRHRHITGKWFAKLDFRGRFGIRIQSYRQRMSHYKEEANCLPDTLSWMHFKIPKFLQLNMYIHANSTQQHTGGNYSTHKIFIFVLTKYKWWLWYATHRRINCYLCHPKKHKMIFQFQFALLLQLFYHIHWHKIYMCNYRWYYWRNQ